MHKLERYARQKESDFESVLIKAINSFNSGKMTEEKLIKFMISGFKLGHDAGHCRGEIYKSHCLQGMIHS